MKKLIMAAAIAAALIATGCAASSGQSSQESASGQAVSSSESASSTQNGEYAISLAVPEGLSGEWRTDDPATQENNIVKLVSAEMQGSEFVARYEAVNDGATSVNLKHYNGPACDLFYTYVLAVENGQISEEGDPVETKAPDASALDPFLSGDWIEDGEQFAQLTVKANSEGGWDAEAVTPATHSGHVYKMTLRYDCDLMKMVYDDGMIYDVPITDSDEGELGDPVATGQKGIVEVVSTDDGKAGLLWNAEANSEGRDIRFVRTDGADVPYADFEKNILRIEGDPGVDGAGSAADQGASSDAGAATGDDGQNPVMNFVGPYACDRANMLVECSGQSGASIAITWGSSAAENSVWTIVGDFDPDTLTATYSDAVKTNYVYNNDGSVKSEEVEYSDGSGRIVFHEGEQLSCTWENDNEPDNGSMEFTWNF